MPSGNGLRPGARCPREDGGEGSLRGVRPQLTLRGCWGPRRRPVSGRFLCASRCWGRGRVPAGEAGSGPVGSGWRPGGSQPGLGQVPKGRDVHSGQGLK